MIARHLEQMRTDRRKPMMLGELAAGLTLLDAIEARGELTEHHRLPAVRAHLLEMAGEHAAALTNYRTAASLTGSVPEQRYLLTRAERLAARHMG